MNPEIFNMAQLLDPLFGGAFQQEQPQNPSPLDYAKLYQPQDEYVNRLGQHIDAMPVRRDPSMLQKIVASVAGLQGPESAEQQERILYGDYGRQMMDWREKLNPLVQAANFERSANAADRSFANQLMLQDYRDRTLGERINRNNVLAQQGRTRLDQAAERIDLAKLKFEEEKKMNQLQGSTIDWGSNQIIRRDGTVVPIRGDIFTTQERLALQQKYRLEAIAKEAENRPGNRDRVTKEVRINPVTGMPELGTYNLDTNVFTPAKDVETKAPVEPGTRKPAETELEKTRATNARALSVKVQDPAGRFVIIKNGRYEGITKPSLGGLLGPSQEDYDRLYKKIHLEAPTKTNTTIQTTTGAPVNNATPPDIELVEVTNPQGKRVRIRKSQLADALKNGYKQ